MIYAMDPKWDEEKKADEEDPTDPSDLDLVTPLI